MSAFNLQAGLEARRSQKLYRHRRVLSSAQGSEVIVDGKPLLAFCSNDYLGLASHPAVSEAWRKAAVHYGTGSGAAHLIVGHSRAHHQLEEELAEFTGRERALLFSTGYMANIGVVSALLDKQDAVFEDRLNHASLLDAGLMSGARFYRYLHRNMDSLIKKMDRSEARRKLVITDGVFSMDGDTAPVMALVHETQKRDAWLMVDDAHGFGTVGLHGGGIVELQKLSQKDVPVLMGTLGKAFGTAGAFVAGSQELIETLIQFARTYIYTTAMPPALAEATRVSLKLVQNESWRREKLNDLIGYFQQGCQASNIPLMLSQTPIQPVNIGTAEAAITISRHMEELGVLVTPIRPPTVPEGSSRLRITLSASHTREHIDQLLDALRKTMKSIAVSQGGKTEDDTACCCA